MEALNCSRPLARRLALVLGLVLSCGGVLAADAVLGPDAAKTIPIVDAHFHVMNWMQGRELLAHMDRNGVSFAGGVGGDGTEAMSELGDRFVRPTGMGRWRALHRNLDAADFANPSTPAVKQALSGIEADLRDRGARVIGEIHVNALTSTREVSSQFKTNADSPTLKALLDLAGKYNRPLNIHAQWDPDTAQEVERLAAANRNARLILSHCGSFATASDIRSLFEKHANVSCDLSARGVPPLKGRAASYAVFDERSIYWGWKKLIEDYPDRFVVGIDTVHNWDEYDSVSRAIRFGLLARLSPETAEKVAFSNAQTWFGLAQGSPSADPWSGREKLVATYNSMPDPELRQFFLHCDREATRRMLGFDEGVQCALAWDTLLRRDFGGNIDKLLEWWRTQHIVVDR